MKEDRRKQKKQRQRENQRPRFTPKMQTEIMQEEKAYEDQVEGRNSVIELLQSDRDINKVYIANGEKHGSIYKIIALAKERKVVVVEIEKSKLNQMAQTENHQGVIAIVPPFAYS